MRNLMTADSYGQWEQLAAQRDSQDAQNYWRWMDSQRQAQQIAEQAKQQQFSNEFSSMAKMAELAQQARQNQRYDSQNTFERDMALKNFDLSKKMADSRMNAENQWKTKNLWEVQGHVESGRVPADIALKSLPLDLQTPDNLALLKALEIEGKKVKQLEASDLSLTANALNELPEAERRLAAIKAIPPTNYQVSKWNLFNKWPYGDNQAGLDKQKADNAALQRVLESRVAGFTDIRKAVDSGKRIAPPMDASGRYMGGMPTPGQTNAPVNPVLAGPDSRTATQWNFAKQAISSGRWTVEEANAKLVKNGYSPLPIK